MKSTIQSKLTVQQKNAVKRRALQCVRELKRAGKDVTYSEVWRVLHNQFNVKTYSDLLTGQFQDVMRFINKFEYEHKQSSKSNPVATEGD